MLYSLMVNCVNCGRGMVFNATFSTISVKSWQSGYMWIPIRDHSTIQLSALFQLNRGSQVICGVR